MNNVIADRNIKGNRKNGETGKYFIFYNRETL